MVVHLHSNHNCVNGGGVFNETPAHGRVGVNPEHGQTVNMLSGTKKIFRLGSWNVGTMRGRSSEVVEAISRRKVDVCCVQEVRWRGASRAVVQPHVL